MSPVSVKLPTRLMILSNELPRLTDASASLPSRMIILQLNKSWYGQEDVGLEQTLLAELPGVLLWAAGGLKRLRERGRFVQPATGKEAARDMVELSSPITAFIEQYCEIGPDKCVTRTALYQKWREWCLEQGHQEGSAGTFGKNLKAAFPEIGQQRPASRYTRQRCYTGIALRGAAVPGYR